MSVPNVTFVRKELSDLLPQYKLIRDVIAGSQKVKEAGQVYLPMPNPADQSTENKLRYRNYKQRAVFYNVTRRTLNGLLGQVFSKEPVIELPSILDPVAKNASGTGNNLVQVAKKAVAYTLAYSRCGILIDYPTIEQKEGEEVTPVATMEDIQSGRIRPVIHLFAPQEIINWRTIEKGSDEVLSLVVLFELWPYFDDGFEIKSAGQYRVLKLDAEGNYIQQIWREKNPTDYDPDNDKSIKKKRTYNEFKEIKPRGPDGEPLKEIPFKFIGSENNDVNPDNPNMYDLADLNLAHYRNSADYEQSCFMMGQPTPVIEGLDESWWKDVLKEKIEFGSSTAIPLPKGAKFDLVNAAANTMIKEAMDTKERQLVALGAKLVEQKKVQRTATEASLEATSENSTLSSSTRNVSQAFSDALKWCAFFVGISSESDKIVFQLNADYDISKATPEARKQAIEEWQKGAIAFSEMRSVLRRAGVATLSDLEVEAALAKESESKLEIEVKRNKALAETSNQPLER